MSATPATMASMVTIVAEDGLWRRKIQPSKAANIGVKATMVAGLCCMAAGQLVLSRLQSDSTWLEHVLPGLLLTPFGGALVFPAVSLGLTTGVTAVDVSRLP